MSNMVIIRASRCIYPIPLFEWNYKWKPYFPVMDEWYTRVGESYVTLEYGDESYRMDEEHFTKHVLPKIPYILRREALKRGKGVSRTEKSYSKKGVKKHESYNHRYG